MGEKRNFPIFHRGMAEVLGISVAELEQMSILDLVNFSFDRGYKIEVSDRGVGPGLTLSANVESSDENQPRTGDPVS